MDHKGQIDDLYYIGCIDENFGRGEKAKSEYQQYVQEAPSGRYAQEAKDRIAALSKDINATQKIKSETELAQIADAESSYQQAVKLQQQKQFDQAMLSLSKGDSRAATEC